MFTNIKRFFSPVREDPKWAMLTGFFSVIIAIANVFLMICLQYLTKAIETGNQHQFNLWISFLGLSFFVIIFFGFISKFSENRFIKSLIDIWDIQYPRKIMELDNTFLERQGTGRMASVWWKGIVFQLDMLLGIFGSYLTTVITIVLSTIILVQRGLSGIWLTIGVAISIIWTLIFHKYSYKRRKGAKHLVTELDRQGIKIVMSKVEILQNNQIENEIKKRLEMNRHWLYNKDREKFRQGICYDGVNLILYTGLFLITLFAGITALKNSSSISDFVLVTGLGLGMIRQLAGITGIARKIFDESIHLEHLRDIFYNPENFVDIHSGKNFVYKKGDIELKNINFEYNTKATIFKKFNLNIFGGEKTAFVGESGGGKTTLIKLLAGYIRPDKGEVLIDGQKLSKTKLTDYYKHIGYLTQDPSVFDGTIYENLFYALDYKPSEHELDTVIKNAKCEFILEFEHGFDTEIGERGIRLSGGQKQRLAIAKIMLKNPNIIILDEPTSALDSFNEEQISIALHNLFKGKTVVVVAHRLQTVKQADIIHYIENGEIIESGTHQELVKLGGRYKKMLDLQSGF